MSGISRALALTRANIETVALRESIIATGARHASTAGLRRWSSKVAIDQKKRNTPSIMLRMGLMLKEDMGEWFRKLDERQSGLFRTLGAMCRANGVSPEKLRWKKWTLSRTIGLRAMESGS
jgi:glycine/D-amino acid oxidase-like deaminating enzyme